MDILTLARNRAQQLQLPYAGAVSPGEAWQLLQETPGARLVDVRTRAEWDWVGRVPGALEIEWNQYPGGTRNPHFLAQLQQAVSPEAPVLFLCRSGARSDGAARLATEAGFQHCFNILEGFEGDKDVTGHRGTVNGWKVAGLPWSQG